MASPRHHNVLNSDPYVVLMHMLDNDVLVGSRGGFLHAATELGCAVVVTMPFWLDYHVAAFVLVADPEGHTINGSALGAMLVNMGNSERLAGMTMQCAAGSDDRQPWHGGARPSKPCPRGTHRSQSKLRVS